MAESLNIHLDSTECAPVVVPEDVTEKLHIPATGDIERIFIHKDNYYENTIVVSNNQIIACTKDSSTALYTLPETERVTDIASIGNTVIVSTNGGPVYLLLKEDAYLLLGRQIPFPTIEFYDSEVKAKKEEHFTSNNYGVDLTYAYDLDIFDEDGADVIGVQVEYMNTSDYDFVYGATHFKEEFWNELDANNRHKNEHAAELLNSVKAKWQEMIASNADKGVFSNPFWAIYGLRLYDDSLLISTPQLISPGDVAPIEVGAKGKWTGTSNYGYTGFTEFIIRLNTCFRLGIKLHDFPTELIEPWRDIVKSVDIYISEDIINTDYSAMTLKGQAFKLDDNTRLTMFQLRNTNEESYISAALSKSVFVKVEEFSIVSTAYNEDLHTIDSLREGYVCDSKKYISNTDRFVGRDLLSSKKYDIKQSLYATEKSLTYNKRLYLLGANEILAPGTKWFNAQKFNAYLPKPLFADYPLISMYPLNWFINPWRSGEAIRNGLLDPPADITMNIAYHIQDMNGSAVVYGQSSNNSNDFKTEYDRYSLNKPDVGSLIIFPNPNCKYAEIEIKNGSNTYRKRVEMMPHPYFPMCSFWYGGNMSLASAVANSSDFAAFAPESRVLPSANKLVSAPAENPFIYSIGSATEFQAKILGAAIATTALSQGQYGQFPLYIFTEDGIWAMEINADGSLAQGKPLPRHVCVNADSITSIDDAVVFVTDQGVMLLRGSEATNISPLMNGRHYSIEGTAKTIVEGQDFFRDLLPALTDNTPFLAFIKQASVAYDYAGERLIFVKKDEKYQYVYKLNTNTWHKVSYGVDLIAPLNSYPECFAQGIIGDKTVVYNLSTILDDTAPENTLKGVIATRPFDLDEPDVFKTIKDVRIRGQFPKGAAKFILLGSNDGINFYTISTLRGKSWKMFRMIILADLSKDDRISWVDVQYETRFTNKLR